LSNSAERALQFLANWQISFDDLVNFVRPLLRSETLVLVGSVSDGLANPLSDIDLVLIGDKGLDQGLVLRETECEAGVQQLRGHEVHVECWQRTDLDRIGEKVRCALAQPRHSASFYKLEQLSKMQLRLVHRLRTGLVLVNVENVPSWSQSMELGSAPEYLTRYWLNQFYSFRAAAAAQLRHGDPSSISYILRLTISSLAGAVLASFGITNTYAKWRPLLLQRNEQVLGKELSQKLLQYLFLKVTDDASVGDAALSFADGVVEEIFDRYPSLREWSGRGLALAGDS
jgi:hypothetical protein